MDKLKLLIIGSSIQATRIIDINEILRNPFDIIGFVTTAQIDVSEIKDTPCLGPVEVLSEVAKEANFFMAVDDDNYKRADYALRAESLGINSAIIVHPRATIAPSARIETGAIIMPGAVINSFAVIKSASIIYPGAVIDSECKIGPFASVGANSVIGYKTNIEAYSAIGNNCTIEPNLKIAKSALIESASYIKQNVAEKSVFSGNPAKLIRKFTDDEIQTHTTRLRKRN